ncbi:Nif3-like dinuclear metal center hexameric protein [Reinekea marina]|uniref:Nif3-like dinuclear metal center hexameric protein n=1 Tax=Reinekea marina TaxID=1310421 RepID=A0ABV7WMQ2_9GAMM|nr:Nif3-like dinuclear metal center hexameric protein [Reinekea marina]MDN3648743.1 Nif3-like dinuclear metal center hexameric protein [Reinekea marina]
MAISRSDLDTYLADLLKVEKFKDYCPNGLQVEGSNVIEKIVTGVTASQRLIDEAIAHNAQAILVHHGYFWKGENQAIAGIKKSRIAALLEHDINLYAYHLPLDAHETLGNNVQLASQLGWQVQGSLGQSLSLFGKVDGLETGATLQRKLTEALDFDVIHIGEENDEIETVAWCTGAAQDELERAIEAGVDAFVSGEISERTVHLALESGVHYFAAGHHATERGGVKALGEHLEQRFDIEVQFIDLPIPV